MFPLTPMFIDGEGCDACEGCEKPEVEESTEE